MNDSKKLRITTLIASIGACLAIGACVSAPSHASSSNAQTGPAAGTVVDQTAPESGSPFLERAIQEARVRKMSISPDSPEGVVVQRWMERMRNDSDIQTYLARGKDGSAIVSPGSTSPADIDAELRLTPEERSTMLEMSLKAFENAPADCGGVKSAERVTSSYMPLNKMNAAELDSYSGLVFAMFKKSALKGQKTLVTNEQYAQARKVFVSTIDDLLIGDTDGTRNFAAVLVDREGSSVEMWCKGMRTYYLRAILAMSQPFRDWYLVGNSMESLKPRSASSAQMRLHEEPLPLDSSAQDFVHAVQRQVRQNIIWDGPTRSLETAVAVRCAPSGTLLTAHIISSSGNVAVGCCCVVRGSAIGSYAIRFQRPCSGKIRHSGKTGVMIERKAVAFTSRLL